MAERIKVLLRVRTPGDLGHVVVFSILRTNNHASPVTKRLQEYRTMAPYNVCSNLHLHLPVCLSGNRGVGPDMEFAKLESSS